MYTCLLYNVSLATSITAQGRALVSSAGMLFESFLADSVKFNSLNEVIEFIDHVREERFERKYSDAVVLDRNIMVEECFAKIVNECGFTWIPNEQELDIIWKIMNNLSVQDINRLYYKNNLYEFMSNSFMKNKIHEILTKLDVPYLAPLKPPTCIKEELDSLSDILKEYVYYGYMRIDRIDKMDRGIKSVCAISDTDSTIISLDAWYRFVLQEIVQYNKYPILEKVLVNPFEKIDYDEFGDPSNPDQLSPFKNIKVRLDYDFYNDEIIELKHLEDPFTVLPQDNMRYAILNIMGYVLDKLINDYMEKFTMNNHSYRGEGMCKIIMKNEFLFARALITKAKKSYATIQEVQEGNLIPQKQSTALDIKGIPCMLKSTMSKTTRDDLKDIMYNDILNKEEISQMDVIKHMAILEKKIINSLRSGNKEYYKPATVKSMDHYSDPMSQQGIKAIITWNTLKTDDLPLIDLEMRNGIDIAKIKVNKRTVDKIQNEELREKCKVLIEDKYFKGEATSIAIPKDADVPEWLMEIIDYDTIVNDNISGFPLESIGCCRNENTKVNWSTMVQL